MQVAPPGEQYFDYNTQNNYAPNSPDTFYAQVKVQPPTASGSDSANTPPSPVASKSRRSVARPSNHNSQSQSSPSRHYSITDSFDLNTSRGPSTQVRKERERQLVNTPREALIQLAIKREYETKKAKQLLTAALLQIELANEKAVREEEARKALEAEKHSSSVKTTQAILTAQTESMNVHQEIGSYKLQVENLKREIKRLNDALHKVENDRDDTERQLVRNRTKARQMQEQNVLLLAREEGRREGFEAGVLQGRLTVPEPPAGGQSSPKDRHRSSSKHRSRKPSAPPEPAPPHPSISILQSELEAATTLREIDEREKLRIKKQQAATEGELDAERQKSKNAERHVQRLIEERRKIEDSNKRLAEEREREKKARLQAEREKDDIQQREMARIKGLEQEKQRIIEAKDRELAELRRERDMLQKEKNDVAKLAKIELDLERERVKRLEEDRERDYERERQREEREHEWEKEKEKETTAAIAAATTAAIAAAVGAAKSSSSSYKHGTSAKNSPTESYQKIPYLPMPAPPVASTSSNGSYGGVPRATSSASQRGYGRDRTMSAGSYSSMLPIDMIQLPVDAMRGGDLSAIPEDVSVHGTSPARPMSRAGPPPMWMNDDMWQAHGGRPITMPRAPGDGPEFSGPITMPRAPADGPMQQPPVTMPRAPMDGMAYTTPGSGPITMPRAPGEAPASYQGMPVDMPRAPGETPATYKPPSVMMPTAPGEGPSTYKPPPVMMPTAPGEGPATYQPPSAVTMPTAPGEAPASYQPPVSMPTAPGEGPSTYQPPANMRAAGEGPRYQQPPSMPRAPGDGPEYHPPSVIPPAPGEAGNQGPITMPRAPGEGPGYQPPVTMPRAPADGPGYTPPVTMPRAPADGPGSGYTPRSHTPGISMPRAPADGPGYVPPVTIPRAPTDGPSSYTPGGAGISMPRAPADGPGHIPPVTMPRAPADGMGSAYTPRSHTPGISMPRAPADGPGYVPPGAMSRPPTEGQNAYTPRSHTPSISMPRAPADGPGYIPPGAMSRPPTEGQGSARSHTPSISMPRAPADGPGYIPLGAMSRPPTEGQGSAYTPRSHTPSISMPRAPMDGPGYVPPGAMSRPPTDGGNSAYTPRSMHARSISMPRAPADGPGYIPPGAMSRPPTDGGNSAYTPRTRSKSISMPRAPMDGGAGYGAPAPGEPPVIPGITPTRGQRGFGGFGDSAGGYVPNNDLLSPHSSSNRNGPVRRTSNGSTGSYEINIEPPSRPASSLAEERQQDTRSYLSPNHRPQPLPQVQPAPRQPRHGRGTDTEPNSPVSLAFEVPHNFVPHTLTDRNGVSTPINHPIVLPTARPTGIARPPSSQGIYGNPLNKNRGNESPPAESSRSPFMPAVPFIPPGADANRSPFIPPAALSGPPMGSPNMSAGWGGLPGRAGSLGGGAGVNTPGSMSRDLTGTGGGQRTSIYGPPASSSFSPNVAPMSMPMPSVFGGAIADDEDNGFDETTLNNTRMNTTVPPVVVSGKKGKKKKK